MIINRLLRSISFQILLNVLAANSHVRNRRGTTNINIRQLVVEVVAVIKHIQASLP